jgi:Ca2+-binding RTX toxin-like protein
MATLKGTLKRDRLIGTADDDTLIGEFGKDTLTGGDGADRFVLTSVADSPAGNGRDVITDFGTGDQIDLSAIDANVTADGHQGFIFRGYTSMPTTAKAGELWYYQSAGKTYLVGGVDGDSWRDLLIELNGQHTLDATQIVGLERASLSGTQGADAMSGTSGGDVLSGLAGTDKLAGGAGKDTLYGGEGNDSLAGNGGEDSIEGGTGADQLWGAMGNDTLTGGAGNDLLVGGFGSDINMGGEGNDVLLSRSDTGESNPAQGGAKVFDFQFVGGDDFLWGGVGADTFRFELVINAKQEIAEKHTSDNHVNWAGVAGENDGVHDHWVDGIGDDTIMDFSKAEGDRIQIAGHTVKAVVSQVDIDGDGIRDYSLITLTSNQGANGGAHNGDQLGTIKVYGDEATAADLTVNAGVTYGAYSHPGEGPYLWDDTGVTPGGSGLGHADHIFH